MLGLPQSTEFNRRIPKQKFYEKLEVSPAVKRAFVEQIKIIYWRNKLAPTTLNIAPGQAVTEIEVLEIRLNQPQLDEAVLRQIDKELYYHLLFVLSFEGRVQAWTGYKESADNGKTAFKVNKYYHTDWMPEDELILKIEGLNMDVVWENFIIQVGGVELEQGNDLAEQIELDERRAKFAREIEKLEKLARREKQPRKKFELVQRINRLKAEMENSYDCFLLGIHTANGVCCGY